MSSNELLWRTLRYVQSYGKFSDLLVSRYVNSIIEIGFILVTTEKISLTDQGIEILKLLDTIYLN